MTVDFTKLFKEFDKNLMLIVNGISEKINILCDKLDRKIIRCEKTIHRYVNGIKEQTTRELEQAEKLVKSELRSKVVMSEWVNGFIAKSSDECLDPISFSFCRFSLNICMCYNTVLPKYFISARIHYLLVSLCGFESNVVVGPALMALFHLSLIDEMKPEIITAGVLPILLKVLTYNSSSVTLTQACKLFSSLALHPGNKGHLVTSGCLHAILDLVAGVNEAIDEGVKGYGAMALTNVILQHDANRAHTVELDAIRPLVNILQLAKSEDNLLYTLQSLANIAYSNTFTANQIIVAHGHNVIVNTLNSSDIQRQSDVTRAGLIVLANLCNNDTNQAHVGATRGAIEVAVRVCEHARDPRVATEAADVILALAWCNVPNKSRLGSLGAIPALMKRLVRHAPCDDDPSTTCLEHCSVALASLLMYHPNHEPFLDIGGLDESVRLVRTYSGARLLLSLAKLLVAMTPRARDLQRYHREHATVPVETVGALAALKRVKLFACDRDAPVWLDDAITLLSSSDAELEQVPHTELQEFAPRKYFFDELAADPKPTNLNFPDLKGLFFSVY